MKYLLIACCLVLAPKTYAQSAPTTTAPVSALYRYCALVVADDRYFNSSRVRLDYGQAAPGTVADPEMAEMAKNIHQAGSIIDVCNCKLPLKVGQSKLESGRLTKLNGS